MSWWRKLLGEEPETKTRLRITNHLDSNHKTYYRGVVETSNNYDSIEGDWNPVLVTSIEDKYQSCTALEQALSPFKFDFIQYPNYTMSPEKDDAD